MIDSRVRYKIPAGPNMSDRAHRLLMAVIVLSGMGQMIIACGQKGALYLPEPEPARQTTVSTETKAVRRIKADDQAVTEAGPAAASEAKPSGAEPTRRTTAGAAAEDESAVKAEPTATTGVEPSGRK